MGFHGGAVRLVVLANTSGAFEGKMLNPHFQEVLSPHFQEVLSPHFQQVLSLHFQEVLADAVELIWPL